MINGPIIFFLIQFLHTHTLINRRQDGGRVVRGRKSLLAIYGSNFPSAAQEPFLRFLHDSSSFILCVCIFSKSFAYYNEKSIILFIRDSRFRLFFEVKYLNEIRCFMHKDLIYHYAIST